MGSIVQVQRKPGNIVVISADVFRKHLKTSLSLAREFFKLFPGHNIYRVHLTKQMEFIWIQ